MTTVDSRRRYRGTPWPLGNNNGVLLTSVLASILLLASGPGSVLSARSPNPPSPPRSSLPLSPDNCNSVLSYNNQTGVYTKTSLRAPFRWTIRASFTKMRLANNSGKSQLQEFINDTRSALAVVFQVSVVEDPRASR